MGYVELVARREGRFLRWCARKRLHEQFRNDPAFRSMFMDEARLAGLVRHPNAVGVLDVGEDDDGPFLIMDFVEGVALSRVIAEAAGAGRSIPMQVAVRICMDAARGLHAAHEVRAEDGTVLGLVHRDVSPQNILIGFDGTVRVTDFGIAKALGNTSRTSAGVLKGNMGYLAPEQLRFEEPDRRSDFFSLGVTLYELLSNRRLYPNKDGFDGTRRILAEPPPDIGEVRNDVPPELCELLFELLAKERDSRPATAVEIAGRLEGILAALIAEEGSVTVSDYMNQHFAGPCQEQRAELAEHLKQIEAGSVPIPTLRSVPPHARLSGEYPAPPTVRPRSRFRVLAVGAVAAGLVAMGAVSWSRFQSAATPTAAAISTPPPPSQAPAPAEAIAAPVVNRAPAPPPAAAAAAPAAARPARVSVAARTGRNVRLDPAPKTRHKVARRAAHRLRTADAAPAPAAPRAPADPKHLAVPLFDQWQ